MGINVDNLYSGLPVNNTEEKPQGSKGKSNNSIINGSVAQVILSGTSDTLGMDSVIMAAAAASAKASGASGTPEIPGINGSDSDLTAFEIQLKAITYLCDLFRSIKYADDEDRDYYRDQLQAIVNQYPGQLGSWEDTINEGLNQFYGHEGRDNEDAAFLNWFNNPSTTNNVELQITNWMKDQTTSFQSLFNSLNPNYDPSNPISDSQIKDIGNILLIIITLTGTSNANFGSGGIDNFFSNKHQLSDQDSMQIQYVLMAYCYAVAGSKSGAEDMYEKLVKSFPHGETDSKISHPNWDYVYGNLDKYKPSGDYTFNQFAAITELSFLLKQFFGNPTGGI